MAPVVPAWLHDCLFNPKKLKISNETQLFIEYQYGPLNFMKNANTFNCKHPNYGTSSLTYFWGHGSTFAPEWVRKSLSTQAGVYKRQMWVTKV